MAYKTAPTVDTYSSPSIPAVFDLEIPLGATSSITRAGMVNVVPIKEGDSLYGDTRYAFDTDAVTTATTCRGMYVWEKTIGTIYYFVVIDDGTNSKVYSSTNGTVWASVNTLATHATTPVRFTEFIDSTNTKKLVMVDGIEGYVFTTNAAGTLITDVDFPTPHIPFPVFIDGYLFLAKANTGDIYNSDLDDPAIWTAGSFISSELYPDDIQALVKVNNYLLAVGTQGCEYFYDAANATASPLARLEGSALPFGTPFPNTIANNKDVVIFLANNNDGEVVLKLIEGLKSVELPCPFISLLNAALLARVGTGAEKLRGYFFRHTGHLCYGICFNGVDPSVFTNQDTFVFSLSAKMWTQFQSSIHTTGTSFPVMFTAPTTTSNLHTYVSGIARGSAFFGIMTPLTAIDSIGSTTSNVQQAIRTPVLDFGTPNLKTMSRLGLIYTSTNYTSTDSFGVYWADTGDNNYTGVTSLYKNFSFPFVTQLGAFRQRQFKITNSSGYPVKYERIVFDINKGQQ